MIIWPFPPREPLTEALEWKTDVFRAKGIEQRFALRPYPRIYYNFEHVLTHEQYNAARALILKNESFLVPDWTLRQNVGPLFPSSGELISFDQSDFNLQVGDLVLLWDSVLNYESATVEVVDSNGITISGVNNTYEDAWLVPLHTAEAPLGLRGTRPAGPNINVSIDFEVNDADELSSSVYPLYRDHDVIVDCPIVASDAFAEPVAWPNSSIDNQVGVPIYLNRRKYADVEGQNRWHEFTTPNITALRYFLHSRKGRWKSFWLPTFAQDFELATAISSPDTSIRVFAPMGITDLGLSTFDIDIFSGSNYYRQVTSYTPDIEVAGRPTILLNIDSDLGVDLASVERISYLRCMRFNVDRFEFDHRANAGASVSAPCIEVLP